MFKFSPSRKKIIEADRVIRQLKEELRRAEGIKRSAVRDHYKGIPGILLQKRLRERKKGIPVDVFS